MSEAKKILEIIKAMEKANIQISSRYGNHEQTKAYLRSKIKNGRKR